MQGIWVGHAEARDSSPGQGIQHSWTRVHHLHGEDALYARLAQPVFPSWDPDWMHLLALLHEHLLHKDQVCYTFHQCCRLLKGVKQALWLNKTKLIEGLPEKVPSLTGDPRDHTEDQDEPVLNAISHAHLWHSTEDIPKRATYCSVIVDSLMQLCKSQILKHSSLTRQIYAPKTCDPPPGNKSLPWFRSVVPVEPKRKPRILCLPLPPERRWKLLRIMFLRLSIPYLPPSVFRSAMFMMWMMTQDFWRAIFTRIPTPSICWSLPT